MTVVSSKPKDSVNFLAFYALFDDYLRCFRFDTLPLSVIFTPPAEPPMDVYKNMDSWTPNQATESGRLFWPGTQAAALIVITALL